MIIVIFIEGIIMDSMIYKVWTIIKTKFGINVKEYIDHIFLHHVAKIILHMNQKQMNCEDFER